MVPHAHSWPCIMIDAVMVLGQRETPCSIWHEDSCIPRDENHPMKYSSTAKTGKKKAGVHRVRDNKLITQMHAGAERMAATYYRTAVVNKLKKKTIHKSSNCKTFSVPRLVSFPSPLPPALSACAGPR